MTSWRKRVEEYVELRRSLGFKLLDAKVGLINFATFLQRRRAVRITIPLAMEWAQQDKTARPAEWARRLSFVRGFARHWSARDSQTEVPPSGLLPHRPGRARPYLYSNDEVRKLLLAARRLPSIHGLRGPTYYCLLGLLAVAGLRISEARNLQTEDVDLKEGVLTIRGAKFGKSRLVPIHPSTRKVLSDYASRRDHFLSKRPATFFVSGRGTRLDGAEIRRTFYFLSRQIGLRGPSDSHGPRLHDFDRDDVEGAHARIRGLDAALAENESQILKANELLAAAFDQFYLATLESYAGELKAAAAAFLPTVRKGIALFHAFGRHTSLEELVIVNPLRESEPLIPVLNRVHTAAGGWSDDLQPDETVASVRAAFEELQRESKRITTEREAIEQARLSAEAEARLAGGPRYQARAVGDYSGPPKYYDPAAERQAQAGAKPN